MDREPGSALPLAEQFRFDAGSPGLDLLATLGFRGSEPVERLTSGQRLRDWLALSGLPRVAVHESDLASVRSLREDGYSVLAAIVAGERAPARATAALSRWAERALPAAGVRIRDGRLEARAPHANLETVLVGLARDLLSTALERSVDLRACAAPTCRLLYLDTSRGHRRQWCSMSRCGNTAKVARHRARTATETAP